MYLFIAKGERLINLIDIDHPRNQIEEIDHYNFRIPK